MRNGIDSAASPHDAKWSQASERFYGIFTDQHGRKWGAECEKKTRHPCGPPLAPYKWRAPLHVPGKYIAITNTAAQEVTIQYERWITDLRQAHADYRQAALARAIQLYGNKGPEALKNNDQTLMDLVGQAPESVKGVQAARAGNKWVLGLSKVRPTAEWVDEAFPVPAPIDTDDFSDPDDDFSEPEEVAAAPKRRGRPPKAEAHPSWEG